MNDHDRELITAFFHDAPHWDYLFGKVNADLHDVSDDLRRAVALGLGYMLATDNSPARRKAYGPFQPIFDFGDRASAPLLSDIDASTRGLLEEIADLPEATASARFNDLLWSLPTRPRAAARARAAIASYRSLAGTTWAAGEPLEDGTGAHSWGAYRRVECLVRARAIASELRDAKLQAELVGEMMAAASACLGGIPLPGPLVRLLDALSSLDRDRHPTGLSAMASDALTRRVGGLHGSSRLFNIAVRLAPSDQERRVLRDEEVKLWVAAAEAAEGLDKLHYLQRAIELSRLHGVGDLDHLRVKLDSLDPESYGLGHISVPVDIPADEIEHYLDSFVLPDGWQRSLRRFAIDDGTPPSGDSAANELFVQELESETPLQFIIPTVIIDSAGRPIRTIESDEEHRKAALIRQEMVGITLWASWAPEILRRVFAHFGIPPRSDLASFFETGLIEPPIAERMARAVELHLDGQYDEAAHILVPRIEAVVRNLAQLTGVPVSREAAGDAAGGVAPLGALLAGLGGRLDPSWLRYFINALSEPTGLNLRNRICHGLLDRAGPAESAILIHIACFLTLLSIRSAEETDSGSVAQAVPSARESDQQSLEQRAG